MYLGSYFSPGAKECFHIKDIRSPILDFGQRDIRDDYDHSNHPYWLWTFRGQLMVISTPYVHGKHFAESPLQLLALVLQLEQLHAEGYFHGDIRGYNVLFRKDAIAGNTEDDKAMEGHRGYLIDFDFAGKQGAESTKYPQGYRWDLPDGFRLGSAGDTIMAQHEWFGLKHILFRLHYMVPPIGTSVALYRKMETFLFRFATDGAPTEAEIKDLKAFLVEIHQLGWKILPSVNFKLQLQEHGLNVLPGSSAASRTGTNHATGSCEKKSFDELMCYFFGTISSGGQRDETADKPAGPVQNCARES
jgi:serine/threonine protein kinase